MCVCVKETKESRGIQRERERERERVRARERKRERERRDEHADVAGRAPATVWLAAATDCGAARRRAGAFGVLIHELLLNSTPFEAPDGNTSQLFKNISMIRTGAARVGFPPGFRQRAPEVRPAVDAAERLRLAA